MHKKIVTLVLFTGLLVPAAGWGKATEANPDGAWILANAPEGPTVELDGRSVDNYMVDRSTVSPRPTAPTGEISGRSLFQRLLSWLQVQLLAL